MIERRTEQSFFRAIAAASCLALVAGCGPQEDTAAATASTPSSSGSTTTTTTTTTTTAQAPSAPTGLAATAGTGQVSLSWTSSSGATGYGVKRATASTGPFSAIGTATSTSYTDLTVVGGATYYYVVNATNAQGTSTDSTAVSATPSSASSSTTVTVTPITSLPAVAGMSNVRVAVNGGSATITFDAVDNARDYRVYSLPSNDNIQLASDGSVIIPNAIYRCAGTYQTPSTQSEDESKQSNGITTRVASAVSGYTRSLSDATLGYVYTTADAAADLTPVYVVGNPDVRSDGDYFYRFQASREKKYTTSASEYANLVAAGWRDDGIAFYVPKTASAATKAVYANANLDDPTYGSRFLLTQGAELSSRSSSLGFAPIFNILASPAAGARPLMRVYYQPAGGRSHDELAVGQADFTRIRYQGLDNAATTLHYSGITATTTLVIEALDRGCPYQGTLATKTLPAQVLTSVSHEPWFTLADLRSSVDRGEVFINGQFDGVVGRPKAIARAYVSVSPKTRTQMDWMSTPASFSEAFTPVGCGSPDGNCFQQFRLQSNTYDIAFMSAENDRWTAGNVLGEFLVNYSDWAADTNGKLRITVRNQKATISSSNFMHATMEVNSVGSARRYPQLIVSDQNIPVQFNLINGRSLVLQTFGDYPSRVDLEICDHVTWEVNQQCPRFIFRHRLNGSGAITGINPIPEADQFLAAVDASTKFDLYASSTRAYIFVNDKPYACANLTGTTGVSPAPVGPTGQVTVTFGDALYHSGADDNFNIKMAGSFISRHFGKSTSRHYDNLGFSSGVAAPTWDETRVPCSSTMTTLDYDPTI